MEIFERIKCFLRANPFYTKYCQTYVNDCRYWVRNMRYYFRLYSWKKDKEVVGNTVYFIIDPEISHPGLADRFKAIIGSYYIAKQNGFNFKVLFSHPFVLSKYLDNASHEWVASGDELSYSLCNTRIIAYNGGGRVPKLCKSVKQYHIYCYIGYDILETNQIGNYTQLWGELFRELFSPTPYLQKTIANYSFLRENDFVAIHLRFVNALEQFEGNQFNFLSTVQKEELVLRCLKGIQNVMRQHPDKKAVIFSDSTLFLNRVQKELPVTVLGGEIGHISFINSDAIVLKTFVDFYMISKASETVRILAPEMYNTVFSYYAALSGGKNCRDYQV